MSDENRFKSLEEISEVIKKRQEAKSKALITSIASLIGVLEEWDYQQINLILKQNNVEAVLFKPENNNLKALKALAGSAEPRYEQFWDVINSCKNLKGFLIKNHLLCYYEHRIEAPLPPNFRIDRILKIIDWVIKSTKEKYDFYNFEIIWGYFLNEAEFLFIKTPEKREELKSNSRGILCQNYSVLWIEFGAFLGDIKLYPDNKNNLIKYRFVSSSDADKYQADYLSKMPEEKPLKKWAFEEKYAKFLQNRNDVNTAISFYKILKQLADKELSKEEDKKYFECMNPECKSGIKGEGHYYTGTRREYCYLCSPAGDTAASNRLSLAKNRSKSQ